MNKEEYAFLRRILDSEDNWTSSEFEETKKILKNAVYFCIQPKEGKSEYRWEEDFCVDDEGVLVFTNEKDMVAFALNCLQWTPEEIHNHVPLIRKCSFGDAYFYTKFAGKMLVIDYPTVPDRGFFVYDIMDQQLHISYL